VPVPYCFYCCGSVQLFEQLWHFDEDCSKHVLLVLYGTQGMRDRKCEWWESTILKCITSAQVKDIMVGTEICWVMGDGRDRYREGWSDQSEVYLQLGYIKKLLWTLALELITKDRTVK
jgi:hypothetical protein